MSDDIGDLQKRIRILEDAIYAIGYDNKSTKKRRFTTKRQSSVLYSITRALCVETVDPRKENRVRFYHPLLHDPKTPLFGLPFASPVSSMGGFDDCGLNWVPPAGSTIMVFFEGGSRDAAFYIGTTWHRNRGPDGRDLMGVFPSREYQNIYAGHRHGYLVGPDDGSQVLPPWNTESSNGNDIDDMTRFTEDPQEQKRVTTPNIYGFKTPEKHMVKLVDGDAKCNRRYKRLEIQSGCGNWIMLKDDHLHYGGQWAHPSCPPNPGGESVGHCADSEGKLPYYTDFFGNPKESFADCGSECKGGGKTQCSKILGGHSSTPEGTTYYQSQKGSNEFFKHKNECRPYKGPGTPQNNRCALPQSGIQFLSISGHTMVFDDSVEEPRGKPTWERSLEDFDFGCNDKYLGSLYIKSATGQTIKLSDVEKESKLRSKDNGIQLISATGNRVILSDHTIRAPNCPGCPPNVGGEDRGIHIESSSTHMIRMIDHLNEQCSPCRKEGGIPVAKASRGFMQLRSGYGLEMLFMDDYSQQETQQQWIQILHPQCVDKNTDNGCNSCDSKECRGPHLMAFHGRPKGTPGIVFLRAGGHSIRQTYDMDVVIVGDKDKNPSDKFTYVSKKHITASEDVDFRYTGEQHILFAEKQIFLMAGRDCPPNEESKSKCKGPCLYSVIVARCPWICPLTGAIHWTEKAASERVFASAYHPCQADCGGGCAAYETAMAEASDPPNCEKK